MRRLESPTDVHSGGLPPRGAAMPKNHTSRGGPLPSAGPRLPHANAVLSSIVSCKAGNVTKAEAMRRSLLLAVAFSALCSGCSTFNDRFYVPGRDPVMEMLGAEYETRQKLWPAAQLPELRPMQTQLIPDRAPPRGVDPMGWPPL